jgi:hypothetical protein
LGQVHMIDFVRLIKGMWIPDDILNWYVGFLSERARARGIHIQRMEFARKLVSQHAVESLRRKIDWPALSKCTLLDTAGCMRIVYPCLHANHFTLVALDMPTSSNCTRAVFLDPLPAEQRNEDVFWAFQDWFKHKQWKVKSVKTHGGIQGENKTECGLFAMQNLDVLLEEKHFFEISKWNEDSRNRDVKQSKLKRLMYAGLLRQHVIWYLNTGTPVHIASAAPVSDVTPAPAASHSQALAGPFVPNAAPAAVSAAFSADDPAVVSAAAAPAPADASAVAVSKAPAALKKKGLYCGIKNGKSAESHGHGKSCSYNSLMQAWFHIKSFRNAVLRCSKSDDVTLRRLQKLFHSLQNLDPHSNLEVFVCCPVWVLLSTHIFIRTLFCCPNVSRNAGSSSSKMCMKFLVVYSTI